MADKRKVLICGAGIAGLTLAYWLHKYGYSPSIFERRPDLSDEGYMIDFYGSGFDVAEKMGLLEQLRAQHYPVPKLTYVDGRGRPQATLEIDKFRKILKYRHFNFMRGDLATVLCDAVHSTVPIQFGVSVAGIEEMPDGLCVELSDGTRRDCDLLIGADGVHSHIRKLLWGDEGSFDHFLGYYVACGIVDNFLGTQGAFYGHMEPKTQASVYSIRGNRLATFFAFRSEQVNAVDRQSQLDTLQRKFAGQGWIVPRLLEATQQSASFYFDAVSQIKLTTWHKGRVALVGDACQCLTLLAGQGASMAMAGAYILAAELQRANGDCQAAFTSYASLLVPEIRQRQAEAQKLARSFVPESWFAIWLTNWVLRAALLPGISSILFREIGAKSIIK